MMPVEVLEKFKQIIRVTDDDIRDWFPNGENSVRVMLTNYDEMVLTYNNENDWKVESRESFLRDVLKCNLDW